MRYRWVSRAGINRVWTRNWVSHTHPAQTTHKKKGREHWENKDKETKAVHPNTINLLRTFSPDSELIIVQSAFVTITNDLLLSFLLLTAGDKRLMSFLVLLDLSAALDTLANHTKSGKMEV